MFSGHWQELYDLFLLSMKITIPFCICFGIVLGFAEMSKTKGTNEARNIILHSKVLFL